MIEKILSKFYQKGFVATSQEALQRMIGIWGYREELDTIHYFLNAYHDPTSIPPATNQDLRLLQLCDVQLLRIITAEINKLGLSYWLDFGTLLGAARHKGFIPWDDDMDIAMPRKDYNRALEELRDALAKYSISLHETECIGIGYKHEQTGIWLDIFAVDEYSTDKSLNDIRNELLNGIKKCRKKYLKHSNIATPEWRSLCRDKYIGGGIPGQRIILYHQPEFKYYKDHIHEGEMIIPLGLIEFENYFFNAPSNVDSYLKEIYGNYMRFPKKGIMQHDLGRGPLYSWAKRNGVDMNEVYKYLRDIANSLSK